MTPDEVLVEHAGDVRHPDHDLWLRALGEAVYSASRVAGIVVDVPRVHMREEFFDLTDEPLGRLLERIDAFAGIGVGVPGMLPWLDRLRDVLVTRNDLIHALPVLHGLHRRTKKDPGRVVNFFDVEDLTAARSAFDDVWAEGVRLLYRDGGLRVDLFSKL